MQTICFRAACGKGALTRPELRGALWWHQAQPGYLIKRFQLDGGVSWWPYRAACFMHRLVHVSATRV